MILSPLEFAMGRILEALKQAEAQWRRPALTAPLPRPQQPEVAATDPEPVAVEESLEEAGDEVPFIEVGGPRSLVEASPTVLAAGSNGTRPAKPSQPSQARAEPPAAPAPPPGAVAFQPFPVAPPPLPPAGQRFARDLVAFHRPDHPVSEQYRELWHALAAQLPVGRPHVLLLTAAVPGAGTTTALLNLAVTAAQSGKPRAVVVDAAVGRSAVARCLGLPEAPGLQEVLAGTTSLLRALRETGQANLLALTAGEVGRGAGARLAGEAMRSVLRHLRGRFDLVLVDAMPWDGRPDVVGLGSFCDSVYLVVPQSEAQKPAVQDLLELIPQQGGRLRGCILTHR
jgi:Mrp family chromosome partitioning ATPase